MKKKDQRLKRSEQEILLVFLRETKRGKYARVDESSLSYPRAPGEREESYYEGTYYYSIR